MPIRKARLKILSGITSLNSGRIKNSFTAPWFFDGIVSLTTADKAFSGFELDSTAFVFSFEGMKYEQEFYTPRYQATAEVNSRVPDFRNVLHWQPDIVTGKEGEKQLIFYTGDTQGTFVGILHGLTPEGLPGTHSFSFEVKGNSN